MYNTRQIWMVNVMNKLVKCGHQPTLMSCDHGTTCHLTASLSAGRYIYIPILLWHNPFFREWCHCRKKMSSALQNQSFPLTQTAKLENNWNLFLQSFNLWIGVTSHAGLLLWRKHNVCILIFLFLYFYIIFIIGFC